MGIKSEIFTSHILCFGFVLESLGQFIATSVDGHPKCWFCEGISLNSDFGNIVICTDIF